MQFVHFLTAVATKEILMKGLYFKFYKKSSIIHDMIDLYSLYIIKPLLYSYYMDVIIIISYPTYVYREFIGF